MSLELDELGGDSGGVISGVNRGAIREMKSALVETRASNVALLENLKAAENQNTFLLDKVDKIEEELWKLRGDVGTGKHVPPGKRVLELVDNPASRWFGKREEDVERLRKENEVLRSLVGDGASAAQVELNGNDEHLVPKETLDVLVQEKGELEKLIKEKEKRLLRLQQVGEFCAFLKVMLKFYADFLIKSRRISCYSYIITWLEVSISAKRPGSADIDIRS